jgi:AraC-like DNA-binding protein
MAAIYSVLEGPFGRAEVVEYNHNLVVHAHSQIHFGFWMGGGTAHAHVASHEVTFSRQMVLTLNSLMSHDLRLNQVENPALFLMLYLNDDWLDELFSDLNRPLYLPLLEIPIDTSIQTASWQLMRHLVASLRPLNFNLEGEIKLLVKNTMAQAPQMFSNHPLPAHRRMVDYRLRRAMAHMRENLSNPTVAEEVASVVGLSRSRFFELFHDQLGTSPNVYWNAVRVEEAVARLSSDKDNMTTVAMELGFSTPGNFSRFFREHMGLSPSAYRRFSHVA